MENTTTKMTRHLKVITLILCVGALPLVWGITGCSTGSRYQQSTGEKIDDGQLSSHVKSALGNDTQYKYGDVNVVTFKGVVQLSGFVNSNEQKDRAGALARTAKGVIEVENNVTVKQ